MTDAPDPREIAPLPEGVFRFRPRGLGNNWLPCFICGHKPQSVCQTDMAAFVDPSLVRSLTLGDMTYHRHPVTDLLERERFLATLDFRSHTPNRVQVKLGACGEHGPNLELLCYLTDGEGTIDAKMLARCLPARRLP